MLIGAIGCLTFWVRGICLGNVRRALPVMALFISFWMITGLSRRFLVLNGLWAGLRLLVGRWSLISVFGGICLGLRRFGTRIARGGVVRGGSLAG